ncbi:unnamed protein product [Nippostrongylus brasiliensis]|uniref:Endonuclease-reverse transcriptase n=1 Tax=Nippostrongylus brasiliensis TaxID=27835 RepID=A0A0N4XQX4_NIPBR|nr:unnamed protein product [Nippostrongylus brasiliensis]
MLLCWLSFLIHHVGCINVQLKKQYEDYRVCIKRREDALSEANFVQRILRSTNKVRDVNLWKYDWQRALMGHDWRPLTKMHEKGMRMEKIADKVKRYSR